MPSVLSILGNPLGDLIKGAGDIISKFVADPSEKIKAQEELLRIQNDFQLKLVDADIAFAQAQKDSVIAEAQSGSWLARNWRPITMLVFVFIIIYNFIIAQWFSLKMLPIPENMWELLKIGIGGYIIGRSFEKVVPATADAIVKAKQ